jgi:membrane-associated protease RseP (regulator of RpoE activity)
MGNPKHLWSGNWERDSAERADELARQRAALQGQGPAQNAPEERLAPAEPRAPRQVPKPGSRTRVALLVGLAALVVAGAAIALLGSGGSGKPKLASQTHAPTAQVPFGFAPPTTTPPPTTKPTPPPTTTPTPPPTATPSQPPTTTTPTPPATTQPTQVTPPPPGLAADARWLGVQFAVLPQGGVTIETVTRGGAADTAGLEPGDALSQINGRPITNFDDVMKAFAPVRPGSQMTITVNRGSTIFTTSFPMPPRPPKGP